MILITGANGQLGTELRYLLDERNEEYVAVDVAEMDITNAQMVDKVFAEVKPSLVYHCAAYTAVDAAEDEGKELDYAINVTGTENVAKAAEAHGATLVYISTDYVFDGQKPVGEEWEVDDRPDPQTEYGRTKRMGEELVEKYSSRFYIIRTLVFGDPTSGWPSLMTVILLIGGFQLLTIGILGKYIGKIFMETKNRPIYVIKEKSK